MDGAKLAPRPERHALPHVGGMGRAAKDEEDAVDFVNQRIWNPIQVSEPPCRIARALSLHLEEHEREWLREVDSVPLGLIRKQRKLVLARRQQQAEQSRNAAILGRLHALL